MEFIKPKKLSLQVKTQKPSHDIIGSGNIKHIKETQSTTNEWTAGSEKH